MHNNSDFNELDEVIDFAVKLYVYEQTKSNKDVGYLIGKYYKIQEQVINIDVNSL